MKKIIFIFVVMLFLSEGVFSQKINRVEQDPQLHRKVLVGPCNLKGLQNGIFSHWFNTEYNNYQPEEKIIKEIAPKINNVHFTIVFGSWCGDSKKQMGRFFKILDLAKYKKHPKIIAVNRSLKAGDIPISKLKIQRIPTFIVYYHKKEIGRIVESPKTNLETDLLSILKKINK